MTQQATNFAPASTGRSTARPTPWRAATAVHARPIFADSRPAQRIYVAPNYGAAESPFARAVVDWFANEVSRSVSGQLLHFSDRRRLQKTAERLGIDRFHANLIIAVAQHNAGKSSVSTTRLVPSRMKYLIYATAAIVQTAIIAGAWLLLH